MEKFILDLLNKIEKSDVWENPMILSKSENIFTKKRYRGINRLSLTGGQFATYNQIKKNGGQVKKGAKSEKIFFYSMIEKKELSEKGKKQFFPLAKCFSVFNINDTDGLDKFKHKIENNFVENDELETVKKEYLKEIATFTNENGRAFYRPKDDLVNVPLLNMFKGVSEYYSTLFHELCHSTGAETRLKRAGILEHNGFGSDSYSKEELVAELGAMLCLEDSENSEKARNNSLAYLKSWMSKLKEKPKELISAFSQAEKARDYIFKV